MNSLIFLKEDERMKVKLYKGPLHGKTYDVRKGMYRLEFSSVDLNDVADMSRSELQVNYHSYEAVVVPDPTGAPVYSMHPDGSMYFVYKG